MQNCVQYQVAKKENSIFFLKIFVGVSYQVCFSVTLFSPILLLFSHNFFQENIFSLFPNLVFFRHFIKHLSSVKVRDPIFIYLFTGFTSQNSRRTPTEIDKAVQNQNKQTEIFVKKETFAHTVIVV